MMTSYKKIFVLFLICVSALVIITTSVFPHKKNLFSDYVINENEYTEIINSRKIDTNLKIDSLSFNNEPLVTDINSKRLYYSLPEEDKNSYNPLVDYNLDKNQQIKFIDGKITDIMIRNNIPIKMIIYDEKRYNIQNIYITTLPIMNIEKNILYFYDNRKTTKNKIYKTKCNLSIRGNSSTFYRKKSYKIKLIQVSPATQNIKKLEHSFLGMPKLSTWHLYAGYNDQDKIRNVLSSKIWKETNSSRNYTNKDIGFEYKYIELFINGKYEGLYALGYPLSEKILNLSSSDLLFKVNNWTNIDIPLKDINYYKQRISLKWGKYNKAYEFLVMNYFKKVFNPFLNKKNALYSIVNIPNQIDFWLFVNFTQFQDTYWSGLGLKNLFIVYMNNQFYQFPWDVDLTWGNTWGHPEYIDEDMKFPRYKKNKNGEYIDTYKKEHFFVYYYKPEENFDNLPELNPIKYLIDNNDTKIKELIKERYKYLREHEWSDNHIIELINGYEKDIFDSGAYLREMERWPLGAYIKDEKEKLSVFKKYVQERIKYSDKHIEQILPEKIL